MYDDRALHEVGRSSRRSVSLGRVEQERSGGGTSGIDARECRTHFLGAFLSLGALAAALPLAAAAASNQIKSNQIRHDRVGREEGGNVSALWMERNRGVYAGGWAWVGARRVDKSA